MATHTFLHFSLIQRGYTELVMILLHRITLHKCSQYSEQSLQCKTLKQFKCFFFEFLSPFSVSLIKSSNVLMVEVQALMNMLSQLLVDNFNLTTFNAIHFEENLIFCFINMKHIMVFDLTNFDFGIEKSKFLICALLN